MAGLGILLHIMQLEPTPLCTQQDKHLHEGNTALVGSQGFGFVVETEERCCIINREELWGLLSFSFYSTGTPPPPSPDQLGKEGGRVIAFDTKLAVWSQWGGEAAEGWHRAAPRGNTAQESKWRSTRKEQVCEGTRLFSKKKKIIKSGFPPMNRGPRFICHSSQVKFGCCFASHFQFKLNFHKWQAGFAHLELQESLLSKARKEKTVKGLKCIISWTLKRYGVQILKRKEKSSILRNLGKAYPWQK